MDVYLSNIFFFKLVLFCISLFVRALFSFLETSITALRLFKLKELAKQYTRYSSLFTALEKQPDQVLITILVANSFTDVLTAALSTNIAQEFFAYLGFSSGVGFSIGIGVASIAIIIFGEILPKNLAKNRGEGIFNSMLGLTNFIFRVLYPPVKVLLCMINTVSVALFKKELIRTDSQWVSSEKEIRFLIDYINKKGLMESEKSTMLKNIFELGYTPVKEIMLPATDIISISIKSSIEETRKRFAKYQYTRLPVYQDSIDNVSGMIHQKDIFEMLAHGEQRPLREIVRPIMFVPETVKVNQLLREFRDQQMHIAMVLNEHGSVVGLITLEDILEEIVGDISDEHESTVQKIVSLARGGWQVNASITLEELEEFFEATFESEDSITLGGFLTEKLQHMPKKGERVDYKNFYFQVQKASHKRVRQVLIFKKDTE